MNNAVFVNISHRRQSSEEKQAEKVLRLLLERAEGFSAWQISANPAKFDRAFDFLATGQTRGDGTIELWVEFHSDPRPSLFPYVNVEKEFQDGKVKTARARVFAAPYISERMAEICWNHGWSWFDLAGNCRLSIPGTPLYIERSGQPPVHERPPARANLGTPEASRVVRTVFGMAEGWGPAWTQRELQIPCYPKVSLGLINKVVNHLKDERFIERSKDGSWRLLDPAGLLAAWNKAYRFDRVRQRRLFTLAKRDAVDAALQGIEPIGGVHAVYAAFSAAEMLAPAVRQSRLWLIAAPFCVDQLVQALSAKEVESGDNLVLLVPQDEGPLFNAQRRPRGAACTSALQTYVDVAHLPGRGEEAAAAILEQVLKPTWKAKGLL